MIYVHIDARLYASLSNLLLFITMTRPCDRFMN